MPEKEKDFNKGERRPAPPSSSSDNRRKKLGAAVTHLAQKKR